MNTIKAGNGDPTDVTLIENIKAGRPAIHVLLRANELAEWRSRQGGIQRRDGPRKVNNVAFVGSVGVCCGIALVVIDDCVNDAVTRVDYSASLEVETVGTAVALKRVISFTAGNRVVSRATANHVATRAASHEIATQATDDGVVTRRAGVE